MGKIVEALINVATRNPAVVEEFALAFFQWATAAMKKAAAEAQAAKDPQA